MNVLKPEKKAALITLLRNSVSQREISRKAGIDRKTIRKYGRQLDIIAFAEKDGLVATGMNPDPIQNPPPRPPVISLASAKIPFHARSACEAHRIWIEEQVRLGRNAMAIYQDLVERFNFNHKYNSVKESQRKPGTGPMHKIFVDTHFFLIYVSWYKFWPLE